MTEQNTEQQVANLQVAQTLRHLNDEWVTALVQADARTLDRIMADDCVFAYPFEGDDKAQFIAGVESGEMSVMEMTRDHVRVRVYGQTAVLTCRDTADWRYRGREIHGQYTTINVYAQRDGQWQLVTVQACPVTH